MPEIQFWVKNPNDEFRDFNTRLDPNGLSFFSSKRSEAHRVGLFNQKTAIYNGKYIAKDVNNVKYASNETAVVDDFYEVSFTSASKVSSVLTTAVKSPTLTKSLALNRIPNHATTLNVRFVSDSTAQVQNASVKIASSSNPSLSPTNLNFKIAQIMHPEISSSVVGSGDTSWTDIPANTLSAAKSLNDNPGISGIATGIASVQHDWFLAISGKSTDIGKTDFNLIFSLEYI